MVTSNPEVHDLLDSSSVQECGQYLSDLKKSQGSASSFMHDFSGFAREVHARAQQRAEEGVAPGRRRGRGRGRGN
eukprot:10053241-Heterocapsa_arctica.AAC.1